MVYLEFTTHSTYFHQRNMVIINFNYRHFSRIGLARIKLDRVLGSKPWAWEHGARAMAMQNK